jgi:hypothetical protein
MWYELANARYIPGGRAMSVRRRRLSTEEIDRRGTELYEKIRPLVQQGNHGRIVVIDVETGEYELGDDPLATSQPLIARNPDSQLMCFRIGHRAVESFGGQNTEEDQ